MDIGYSTSLGTAPLDPPIDSSEGRQGCTGTVTARFGDSPPSPPPLTASDPGWLQGVAARERQQSVWAKEEMVHWEEARDDAVAASTAVPPQLDGVDTSPSFPHPDELASLMCGRLALPALQQLTRPPGLAVFCSSTVRRGRGRETSSSACFGIPSARLVWQCCA